MSLSVDAEMRVINSLSDMAPFAGHIVAYKSDSVYFADGVHWDSDHTLGFGYISKTVINWSSREQGYRITLLLHHIASSTKRILVASEVCSPISMRLASRNEICTIRQAIYFGKVCFSSMPYEKVGAILERHLAALEQ
jgi:hypothetical protein